jgi:hypothetical protein
LRSLVDDDDFNNVRHLSCSSRSSIATSALFFSL